MANTISFTVIGMVGFFQAAGAFFQAGWPNKKSAVKAKIASCCFGVVFASYLFLGLENVPSISAVQVFSCIGCVAGLLGCARSLFARHPRSVV